MQPEFIYLCYQTVETVMVFKKVCHCLRERDMFYLILLHQYCYT